MHNLQKYTNLLKAVNSLMLLDSGRQSAIDNVFVCVCVRLSDC